MSEAAHTPTITCPPHPPTLTSVEARDLARHLLEQADTVSPRDPALTRQQILLELDALRSKVIALTRAIDEHLPLSADGG